MSSIARLAASPDETDWILWAYTPRRIRRGLIKAIIAKGNRDQTYATGMALGLGMAVLPPTGLTAFAYGAYSDELAVELDDIEEGERKGYMIPAAFMTPQYRAGSPDHERTVTTMKRTIVAAVLLLGACAPQYPDLVQPGQDPSQWSPRSPAAEAQAQAPAVTPPQAAPRPSTAPTGRPLQPYEQVLQESGFYEREAAYFAARDAVLADLAAFQREPTCDSASLARATTGAAKVIEPAAGVSQGAIQQAAGVMLDVADAAADAGCPEQARPLYREVLKTFLGSAYAAYRQRAEIGLTTLR